MVWLKISQWQHVPHKNSRETMTTNLAQLFVIVDFFAVSLSAQLQFNYELHGKLNRRG